MGQWRLHSLRRVSGLVCSVGNLCREHSGCYEGYLFTFWDPTYKASWPMLWWVQHYGWSKGWCSNKDHSFGAMSNVYTLLRVCTQSQCWWYHQAFTSYEGLLRNMFWSGETHQVFPKVRGYTTRAEIKDRQWCTYCANHVPNKVDCPSRIS